MSFRSVLFLSWLFCEVTFALQCKAGIFNIESDACLNCTELIKSKGFAVEEHSVTTADGYILLLVRIPGRNNSCCKNQPHLLVHGILASSSGFFINFNQSSIGFALSNAGCDVWAVNVRGNRYSRQHVTLLPSEKAFWDFTWDEIAAFDLPAVIDFIKRNTGYQKINILGHSQGGAATFALLSEKPMYNNYINHFVAIAPAVFLGNMTGLMRAASHFMPIMLGLMKDVFHKYEFGPYGGLYHNTVLKACSTKHKVLCKSIFQGVFGRSTQANYTRMPVFMSNFLAGTSVNNMQHYMQSIQSGKFQKFNFGRSGNLKKYGQAVPPEYDLGNVKVPVTLFNGLTDNLVTPKDINKLRQIMGSKVIKHYQLPSGPSSKDGTWDHTDFVYAPSMQYFAIPYILNAFTRNC